jgi:dihydrofolate reductase
MAAGLIDQYLLMIHPLVLGAGRRLFPEGAHASPRLTDTLRACCCRSARRPQI